METQRAQQSVRDWFAEHNLANITLSPLSGLTNHVYLVQSAGNEQIPARCIIRIANHSLKPELSPLLSNPKQVLAYHIAAAELNIAPPVIGYDSERHLIAVAEVGSPRPITAENIAEIHAISTLLISDQAQLIWSAIEAKPDHKSMQWSLLPQLISNKQTDDKIRENAATLLEISQSLTIHDMPLLPSHSDWNSGNWLHDGNRWWLIDWDFAGWRPKPWDWAGLIIEHQWSASEANEKLSHIELPQLSWFCACIALIHWDWHENRGSTDQLLSQAESQATSWMKIALSETEGHKREK